MATDREDRGPDPNWTSFLHAVEEEKKLPPIDGRQPRGSHEFSENLKAIALVLGFLVVVGGVGALFGYLRGPKMSPAERQMRGFEKARRDRQEMQRELKYLEASDDRFQERKRKELEETAEREREQKERLKRLNPWGQEPKNPLRLEPD